MGTNYDWYSSKPCAACGQQVAPLHIGKSSGGWCFSLHVYPEAFDNGPRNWEEWKELIFQPDTEIRDEYGEIVSPDRLVDIVTKRSWPRDRTLGQEWFTQNHAVPGPNGLARHAVDLVHCINHGEGTWDYCVGDFS